jgi:cobalt-zinc-cadmium efflux system protein
MTEHKHEHNRERSRKDLKLAIAITGSWFLLELLAGIYTNSLALIADAAHMLVDLAALALSLFALKISARPATHKRTFGYLRAEILAALVNGIFLVLVSAYIFYEAYSRFMAPPRVRGVPMLAVAASGLAANLVTAAILFRSHRESLNLRGAFLHVAGDTLGSVGAIAAGLAMVFWNWYMADPIASIIVALLVLISSWQLVTESVDVLLEAAPRGIHIPDIIADLGKIEGILSIHELHVWSITSGMPAMSCHVVIRQDIQPDRVLDAIGRVMRDKYHIEHTTTQIEQESRIIRASEVQWIR